MKKVEVLIYILLLIVSNLFGQGREPRGMGNAGVWRDWIKTGTITFTNKTLTSPTITSPTVTGTGSIIVSSAEVNGNLTMANDEIWANSTDGDMILTFNDDAAVLGQLIFTSSVDSPDVADNDIYEIVFQANDDSSGLTDWVTLQAKILDASDESEDSEVSLLTWLAGTEYTSVKWAGNVMTQYADAAAYYTVTQANGGGVTFDGTSDGTASFTFSDAVLTGADGSGVDVTLYSGTAGDNLLWDASEERLVVTGTDNQDALQIADGDVSITDNVNITGDFCHLPDTSSVNDTYGGTMDPVKSAWVEGTIIVLQAGVANTGACTVAPDGLAAEDIKTISGADPANNDILAGMPALLWFNGTDAILMNPATTCD